MVQGIWLKSLAAMVLLAGGIYLAIGKDGSAVSPWLDAPRQEGVSIDVSATPSGPALKPKPMDLAGVSGPGAGSQSSFRRSLNQKSKQKESSQQKKFLRETNSGAGRSAEYRTITSASSVGDDDIDVSFLQLAYQQALTEDPQLAAEILREINGEEVGSALNGEEDGGDQILNDDGDQLAENETTATDDDFPWCQNRPPLVAETFRCPCPSDPGYRPYWREHINPEIPAAAGC